MIQIIVLTLLHVHEAVADWGAHHTVLSALVRQRLHYVRLFSDKTGPVGEEEQICAKRATRHVEFKDDPNQFNVDVEREWTSPKRPAILCVSSLSTTSTAAG